MISIELPPMMRNVLIILWGITCEMSGFWSSEAAEKIRSIELGTPGMGVNLWGESPLYENLRCSS